MRRRDFILSAGVAAGFGLAEPAFSSGFFGQNRFRQGPADVCRAPGSSLLINASTVPAGTALRFEGTHILAHGAIREIADKFKGPLPLSVVGGGCDNGIASVRQGSADLGGLCCPVEESRGKELRHVMVARDIKAVIVHPSSALRDIDESVLKDLVSGRIQRWKDFGGEDKPIALVIRDHCPDFDEPVRLRLLENKSRWSKKTLFVSTDQQLVDTVARFSGGIGIVSWVFAKPLEESGKLRILSVDGVAPSSATVRNGRYPLHGPLNLVYKDWLPIMEPFFEFLFGPEGRAIIAKRLVPVTREEAGYRAG